MTSSNNIDLISWSDEQEDSLRALFDTFDINGNGMLDLPELKEMLTLVQQTTETEENNEVFGEGEKVLLNAAIETMTTFSITTGVTFSEFIHFWLFIFFGFDLKLWLVFLFPWIAGCTPPNSCRNMTPLRCQNLRFCKKSKNHAF